MFQCDIFYMYKRVRIKNYWFRSLPANRNGPKLKRNVFSFDFSRFWNQYFSIAANYMYSHKVSIERSFFVEELWKKNRCFVPCVWIVTAKKYQNVLLVSTSIEYQTPNIHKYWNDFFRLGQNLKRYTLLLLMFSIECSSLYSLQRTPISPKKTTEGDQYRFFSTFKVVFPDHYSFDFFHQCLNQKPWTFVKPLDWKLTNFVPWVGCWIVLKSQNNFVVWN